MRRRSIWGRTTLGHGILQGVRDMNPLGGSGVNGFPEGVGSKSPFGVSARDFPAAPLAPGVNGAAPSSSAEAQWLESTPRRRPVDRLVSIATFGFAGNRVSVDRVGISTEGVTFVFGGKSVMIPWPELVPSKMQLGRGYVVVKAKEGTPPLGGAWAVDRAQGRAILTHPNWGFPGYSRAVIPKWLT